MQCFRLLTTRKSLGTACFHKAAVLASTLQCQASLSAAHAIRLSLRNPVGGVEQAFVLANSLCRLSPEHEFPVAFGRTFPEKSACVRFLSHTLLHGLIRMRKRTAAAALAEQMMQAGLRVRSTTLTCLFTTLYPRAALPPPDSPFSRLPSYPVTTLPDLLNFARAPGTRIALQLFSVAEQTNHRRSNGMFATLLTLCIINGEIILASLLFGFVCNEWNVRQLLQPTSNSENVDPISSAPVSLDRKKNSGSSERLKPNLSHLKPILKSIDYTLSAEKENQWNKVTTAAALQALANLAFLLDSGFIPFGEIGPLLRSLYNAPNLPIEVWIPESNLCGPKPKDYAAPSLSVVNKMNESPQITAVLAQPYHYFHSVLFQLVVNLYSSSSHSDSHPCFSSKRIQKLDEHACNSLLHYILRYRISPQYAAAVLRHLSILDNPRNVYDSGAISVPRCDTLNILIQNGTRLRKDQMVHDAVDAYVNVLDLKKTVCSGMVEGHDVETGLHQTNSAITAPLVSPVSDNRTELYSGHGHTLSSNYASSHPLLRPTITVLLALAQKLSLETGIKIDTKQERFALSILVSHLVKMGSPTCVREVVYLMFPELRPQARYYHTLKVRKGKSQKEVKKIIPQNKESECENFVEEQKASISAREGSNKQSLPWRKRRKEQKRKLMRFTARELIRALYGPHVYTTLISALFKSGQTCLARAVWEIGCIAERTSWIFRFGNGVGSVSIAGSREKWSHLRPWLLPAHAYTIMLRCCALDYRRPSFVPRDLVIVSRCKSQKNGREHAELVRRKAIRTGWGVYLALTRFQVRQRVHSALIRIRGKGSNSTSHGEDGEPNLSKNKRRALAWVMRMLEGRHPLPDDQFFHAAEELFCVSPWKVTRERYEELSPRKEVEFFARRVALDMQQIGLVEPDER